MALSIHMRSDGAATRTDAFLDFFRDRCEELFAHFGMEAVTLYNAAQAERRSLALEHQPIRPTDE